MVCMVKKEEHAIAGPPRCKTRSADWSALGEIRAECGYGRQLPALSKGNRCRRMEQSHRVGHDLDLME